jgi:hypothetical protein
MLVHKQPLRILDFDTESRPLSFWYGDKTTAEVTAIASAWVDEPDSLEVHLLGRYDAKEMYMSFYERFNQADIVTAHYLRKHDLPLLNAMAIELGLPQLGPKMTCDTRLDLKKKLDLPASQEYLAELLNIPAPKVAMSQHRWRQANRLTEEGIIATGARVAGDVYQHILLREEMLRRDLLHPPRVWRP